MIIGALERFVTEEAARRGWQPQARKLPKNGKTAAIIGAGPAGITCADELNKAGFDVTVFDKQDEIGGLLTYGVPSFKLDKTAILRRRRLFEEAGVRFVLGKNVGEEQLKHLIENNDVVFLGTGAQKPRGTNLLGRNLGGVIDGLAYLEALNKNQLVATEVSTDMSGKCVLVLGGGDTAMDCARSAVRQGAANVAIAYRSSSEEMRASPKEIAAAQEEGVKFAFHKHPEAFVGKKSLQGVRFTEGDGEHGKIQSCDVAIVAFGQEADDVSWLNRLGIDSDDRGFIITDDAGRTTHPKVFVGGDSSHGPDIVVAAVVAGRRAGRGIVDTTE